jgi:diguanylate cyclase
MFDDLDPDYATAIANRANRLMARHGVTPTPGSFAVWFNYARGTPPELRQAIDVMIADSTQFDPFVCRDLFSEYIGSSLGSKGAEEVPAQLRALMTEAKHYVANAISDSHTQRRAISDVADRAEEGIDPKSLVACLMDELARAAAHAAKLERNLGETARELDSLRELLNKAEQRANTDTLTGLANRRAVYEFLRTSQISAMQMDEPLSVLMLDIDHFKKFNDNFGHGVGDQVLRLLANVLRKHLRESDLPGRYGGEELIAVLPRATLAACESVAERIRGAVSECKITRRSTGEVLPEVTVSIGIAQFRLGESTDQLIERCDAALYLAKRIGRNHVVTETRLEGRCVA